MGNEEYIDNLLAQSTEAHRFQTQPEHQDSPPQTQAIRRLKVTAVNVGGNSKLAQGVAVSHDNHTSGTRLRTFAASFVHAVGDFVYVAHAEGASGQYYHNRPVYLIEILSGLPPGTGQYKVLMLMDDLSPGTWGWDWPRLP